MISSFVILATQSIKIKIDPPVLKANVSKKPPKNV